MSLNSKVVTVRENAAPNNSGITRGVGGDAPASSIGARGVVHDNPPQLAPTKNNRGYLTSVFDSKAWPTFSDVEIHPYLTLKQVKACPGLKQHDGELLVPMYDQWGLGRTITGWQRIPLDGKGKKFAKGSKTGGFLIRGSSNRYIVAEGLATGLSLHEHTDSNVVVCFGMGNALKACDALKKAGEEVLACLDAGTSSEKVINTLKDKGFRVIVPDFGGYEDQLKPKGESKTDYEQNDFNDLACIDALRVQNQVEDAFNEPEPQPKKSKKKTGGKAVCNDYIELLENTFKKVKVDIITGELKVWVGSRWEPAIDMNGLVMSKLESLARDSGGFYKPSAIRCHLKVYEEECTNRGLLLEFAQKWDGKDRIRLLSNCLVAKNFNQENIYELVRAWLVRVLKKASGEEVQNMALILQGEQGIGKDHFLGNFARLFGPKYVADLVVRKGQPEEEIARVICSYILVNISEWDRLEGLHSTTKDAVTAPSKTWTPKYQEKPKTRRVTASIMASINPKSINTDSTGARRYLAIELERVRGWDKNRGKIEGEGYEWGGKELPQVLAQLRELAEGPSSNWQESEETKAALKVVQDRLTPGDPIVEATEDLFEAVRRNKELTSYAEDHLVRIEGKEVPCWKLPNDRLGELIKKAAEDNGVKEDPLRAHLKREGYCWRTKVGRGYYIPKL